MLRLPNFDHPPYPNVPRVSSDRESKTQFSQDKEDRQPGQCLSVHLLLPHRGDRPNKASNQDQVGVDQYSPPQITMGDFSHFVDNIIFLVASPNCHPVKDLLINPQVSEPLTLCLLWLWQLIFVGCYLLTLGVFAACPQFFKHDQQKFRLLLV